MVSVTMAASDPQAAQQLTPSCVAREFVRQYYTMMSEAPKFLHRFYSNDSTFLHGSGDAVVGQQAIHSRIMDLEFVDCHTKIQSVEASETLTRGVVIQVAGKLSNAGGPLRSFVQTFVLAPQSAKKYYVHNDIFRYIDDVMDEQGKLQEGMNEDQAPATNGVQHEEVVVSQTMPPRQPAPPQRQEPPVPVEARGNHGGHGGHGWSGRTGGAEPATDHHQPAPQQQQQQAHHHPPPQSQQQQHPPQQAQQHPPQKQEQPPQQPQSQVQAPQQPPQQQQQQPQHKEPQPADHEKGEAERTAGSQEVSQKPKNWASVAGGGAGRTVFSQAPPVQPSAQPVDPSRKAPQGPRAAEGSRQSPAPQGGRGPRTDLVDDKLQLFVGGIPREFSEEDVIELFRSKGVTGIREMRINRRADPHDANRPCFGFVVFENEDQVMGALNRGPFEDNGVHLHVEAKRAHEASRGGRGGGGGHRGGMSGRPPYGGGDRGGGRGGRGGMSRGRGGFGPRQ